MQPPVPVLSVVTFPPGATKTQQRIVIDGVRGAIFEYVNGGPVGALVSSWASKAGTDPYGNTYPQGFNAGSGSSFSGTNFLINSSGIFVYSGTPANGNLIISIAPAAGTDAFGNAYPQGIKATVGTISGVSMTAVTISASTFTGVTINGSTFNGTDWISNANGSFYYSGTPALGNLIASIAPVAGTDGFGNVYAQGVNAYTVVSASTYAIGLNQIGGATGYPGVSIQNLAAPPNSPPGVFALGAIGHATAILTSGARTNLDTPADVQVSSHLDTSTVGGAVYLTGGYVALGASQTISIDDNRGQMNFLPVTSPAAVPGSGTIFASANGDLEGFDGAGNSLKVGESYANTRVNAVVNSLSFTALKSMNVLSGVIYHVHLYLVYTGNQAAGAPLFSFSHGGIGGTITDAVGNTTVDGNNIGVWLNAAISDRTGPTLDTGGHIMTWDMSFTAPSTGVLTFSVACSVATDTWNAKALDMFLRALS